MLVRLSPIGIDAKQDCKALLEAKYCPRVAAVSCTQKQMKPYDLNFLFMTLIFSRLLGAVKVGHMFAQNFMKLNAAGCN